MMDKRIRLTTDEPETNMEWIHNCTKIIDTEVFINGINEDINLVDYCKQECKNKCDLDLDGNAEEFGELMDCDCVVSRFYWTSVGHAHLRTRLMQFEVKEYGEL